VDRTYNHIDELIGKYLAQEASAEERKAMEAWLEESPSNRHYFDQFKTIFDNAASVGNIPHFDTDAAWSKLRSKLHQKTGGRTVDLKPESSGLGIFWRIAASIVIIAGVGFFTYRMFQPTVSSTMEVATETKTKSDTLPDGSDVFLNKKTTLAYAYNKSKKTHTVKLKGEAYFNIQHQDDKTFIVDVGGVMIRDIGTSFNVKAYPESNTIEVAVEEGEVLFYSEDKNITLRAGGKGTYHKDTKTFEVADAEPNISAYKTKFFIFSDSDLGTVVEQLNRVYDKQIIIENHLRSCRYTVSFSNEEIDEIANIIAETHGLTVKTVGDTIMLEGECRE
jgi:transmembrane sensor